MRYLMAAMRTWPHEIAVMLAEKFHKNIGS
jgi:hypothetical protein